MHVNGTMKGPTPKSSYSPSKTKSSRGSESNFYSKLGWVINQCAQVQYLYGLGSQDVSRAHWRSWGSCHMVPTQRVESLCLHVNCVPKKVSQARRHRYLKCLLLFYYHTWTMTVLLRMLVKSLPENGTFL